MAWASTFVIHRAFVNLELTKPNLRHLRNQDDLTIMLAFINFWIAASLELIAIKEEDGSYTILKNRYSDEKTLDEPAFLELLVRAHKTEESNYDGLCDQRHALQPQEHVDVQA
jgi:hypothetical protein